MAQLSVTERFSVVTTTGDHGSLEANSHGDLYLKNPARRSGGRALVPSGSNTLVINWANDFSGGVQIQGKIRLPNLGPPPSGVETDRVLVDAEGNLYKAD